MGRRQGCEPPPELTKRWPLGIDRIKQIWDANADGRLLAFFCSVAESYEPHITISQYLLAGPRAYHVLHPENVEAVLSTNFKGKAPRGSLFAVFGDLIHVPSSGVDYGFGSRPTVFAPLLGKGIFTQEGAPWKHSRELLRKQFTRAKYRNLELSFCEHVDNLIDRMPVDGVVDLQPLFFNLTLDTTTALLFGSSVYSLRADVDQAADNKIFSESFGIAQEGLAKRFRLAPFHSLYNPPSFARACRNVHRFVEDYIESEGLLQKLSTREESFGENASWFIEQVASESETITELRDQLLNVLLAGRDTTACCLSWTLYVLLGLAIIRNKNSPHSSRLLVRHPHVMERVRREITTAIQDSASPTREDIQKMPFLACVIKESMSIKTLLFMCGCGI